MVLGEHHRKARLLEWVGALDLVVSGGDDGEIERQVRQGRDVEIKITVADGMSGSYAFRDSGRTVNAAVVVATLVSTQGLSSGKGLMADGALVKPASAVGCRSSRSGGCCGGGGSVVIFGAGEFPVAGLVATESLVRGEGFLANRAFVSEVL